MFTQFPNIKILIQRLLLALFLAFLCRLFFLIFNPVFFSFGFLVLVQAFLYGFIYDFSALIYLNALFILLHLLPLALQNKKGFQQILMGLFLISNGTAILLNLIDTGYFAFSGKRSGMDLFKMGDELQGLKTAYLIDFWYLYVILFLLLGLMVCLYLLTYKKSTSMQVGSAKPFWFKYILVWILTAGISFIGARGSFGLLPLNTFDAARQTRPELVPLVVNTPFNMIISTQQSGLQNVSYFSGEAAKKLFSPVQQVNDSQKVIATPPNIVLIIVESLGKEYVGYFNKQGYTPFLDSLMKFSTVYSHAYSSGKKSVEGIPAILASMPSWLNTPYLSSYYQSNALNSTGAYLNEMGYQTSFYHGGRNGTMSFDNFIAISKGGAYFGLNQYEDEADFDGKWGIYDEPYLKYFARELNKKPTPFFSTVFTLSSHHPYSLPGKYKNKFIKGSLPIHNTIEYTDFALQQFFEMAKKESWFKNTVFIITADHSSENQESFYQSPQGKYLIPLFVYKGGQTTHHEIEKTVSQLDIMPIILSEAHYDKPFFSFGTYLNPADKENKGGAMQFQDQYYQLVQWPYVYQFDGRKEMGFFNIETDSFMNQNLLNNHKYNLQKLNMDSLLKSMIQQYNQALINNETGVK
ncbi:MAG: LTA synthase family protein [Bacteroidota bacterium]|nr:LTA synthase family protein [Bacteroidota bacterium]